MGRIVICDAESGQVRFRALFEASSRRMIFLGRGWLNLLLLWQRHEFSIPLFHHHSLSIIQYLSHFGENDAAAAGAVRKLKPCFCFQAAQPWRTILCLLSSVEHRPHSSKWYFTKTILKTWHALLFCLWLHFWTAPNGHFQVRYWNEWRWRKWGMPMTSTTSLIWFVQCGWLSSRCGKIFLEDPRSCAAPH